MTDAHRAQDAPFEAIRNASVVFVTRFYPYPAHTGALQYSDDLLRRIAAIARDVRVVCGTDARHRAQAEAPVGDTVTFHTFSARKPSALRRLVSLAPNASIPFANAAAEAALTKALEGGADIAVIDHVGASWAGPLLPANLPLIYCTHNDEYETRLSIAREARSLRAAVHRFDAWRIRRRDEKLCRRARLVTAISRADFAAMQYRYGFEGGAVIHPLWHGPVPEPLDLETAPRSIVLLGSLLWEAKKDNLIRFLETNHTRLEAAGVGVIVAGRAEPAFLERMGALFPGVRFMGEVESERDALREGRIGVIYGEAGGGFRLTGLTYAFHGLPIAALPELVADMALSKGRDFVALDSGPAAGDALAAAIDDVSGLKARAEWARKQAIQRFVNYVPDEV